MKSQIKRFSKSTLSVLLSLCMLVSCMTVGIIATDAAVNWYDYSGNSHHYIYYDDSTANISAGGTKNVYAMMGYTGGSNVFQMDRVSTSTLLYRLDYNNKWEGCVGFGVKGASSTPSGAVTTADRYTTSGNFNGNATVFAYGSKTGTTLTTNAWTANNGDEKTSIKNNVSLKTKVADAGSSNYSETSTTIATLTLSSHYWNGSNVSSAGDASGFADGSVTYNNAVGAAAIGFSYSDLNSNYNFIGWYDSSGNQLGTDSTYSGYQQGHVSAISYYAYFQKKEAVYGVVGTENLTGNNWDQTSSDNDMTKSGTTYTKVFSNKSAGNYEFKIAQNRSWDISWGYDSSKVSFSGLASNNGSTSRNNIKFKTSGSSNITITFDSSTENITVNAVSNLTPLDAPTNIKLNNASSDLTVDTTVVGAKIRLSWNTVANAGTYKVYKGETLVDTVSTLFYDIERAYSSTGTYTVVAVPSDANTYTESPKSTGLTLTVNKSKLNKPTISVQPTDIKTGSSVELTVTDTNTGFTASQFNYYYYTGSSVSIDNNHLMTPGVAKTLSPTSDTTYKACAYPVDGSNNDYYLQSDTKEADVVYVSTPAWHLTGDLVTGQGGETGWPTKITTYPVNTFVSHNVFYRSVTVSGGAATAKHYFRLTNQTNQYGNGSDTDMAAYDGSTADKKLKCSTAGTSGAMYVTGNGTFKIYVDQSSSSAPKVWVVSNEWSITSTAYYQTYNLTNDAYNAAQKGTTGGTVSGNVEVVKGTSTTLTATPATGYAFDGWYSNTDFAAAHKVSSNASYTFTPSANGDYYALFKKIVNRYNVKLSFTSTQANVSATYHSTTINTNNATMSVPEGATVTYSISAKTGAQIDSVLPSSLSTGTNRTFTMPSEARTITVTSSWKEYTLNGTVSPNHGTLKFYEDDEGVINLDKELPSPPAATFEQYFWAVYIPDDNYTLESIVATGGNTKPTRVSTDYANNRARFQMGAADGYIKANVVLQHSVTYYIDMHNTDMTGNKKVSIGLYDKNGTILSDARGNECKGDLTRVNNKTNVYSISIVTPFIESDSSYEKMSIKPKYNGNDMPAQELTADQVTKLLTTKEVWLEAVNEESKELKLTYNTKATPAVQNGYRRIYLARPYNWCYTENNEQKGTDQVWNNIGIYYWGSDYGEDGEGWFKGTAMNRIGSDSEYCYYYVDIPKTLDHTIGNQTVKDKVDNIIFQGWSSQTRVGDNTLTPDAQTEDIKQIADSDNFFVLSKNGSTFTAEPGESVVVPDYTRYVQSAQMNVNVYNTLADGSEIKINPTYTGEKITYTSSDEDVVTVDANGKITPHDSGTATITVKIYGTIGKKLNDADDTIDGDYLEYDVTVTVNDPGKLEEFKLMALESQNYTVNIPYISNTKPGFFDINNTQITVTGISGASASTDSAIINPVTGTEIASFTVKYAKSNSDFAGYNNIKLTGNITTKSIRREGADRYGLAAVNPWKSYLNRENETVVNCTTSKSVTNGQETVLSKNIEFSTSFDTYSAIFEEYQYVDVTFVYDYYEYVPQIDNKGTPDDTSDDMVYYQYQPDWAGANGRFETGFNTDSAHNTLKTYTVSAFEVRDVVKSDLYNGNTSIAEKKLKLLVSGATAAIGVMPSNNYYSYSIDGSSQVIPKAEIAQVTTNNTVNQYAVEVHVHMNHSPQTYSVVLNGIPDNNGSDNGKYYYQENAELSKSASDNNKVTKWYAVEKNATTINTDTDPLLATGDGYEFRVKGDTYIRTQEADNLTDKTFNRSEVDFSHYEVIHRDNPKTEQEELVDYLLQNFYIADFFDPNKVFATRTIVGSDNTEEYKPEDPQFVGGGVVYFSVDGTSKLPRSSNAVGFGYVNSDGTLNKNAVKEMLKSEILSSVNNTNYNGCGVTDFETLSNTIGEQDALKVAYGTEIDAHQYVENNIKTGVLYRYLPLETFSNDSNKWDSSTGTPLKDDKQNYYTTLNNNTFRYSNTLQSYQYVYASGNENKETNNGRDMRLYSYYVYSYVAYNQETNVPETKYEIVISDNYSDASTYWNGNTGN